MDTARREFLKRSLILGTGCLVAPPLLSALSPLLSAKEAEKVYIVQNGDTLSKIASQSQTTVNELKALNDLKNDRILTGQKLILPGSDSNLGNETPIIYKVQRGDTLSEIAQRQKTTVAAIKSENHLTSDVIRVGQELKIYPGKGATSLSGASGYRHIQKVVDFSRKLKITTGRWKWIVGHHSGIRYGNAKSYDAAHRRRGMTNGLAYHFVIGNGVNSGDGEVEIGPRWERQLQGGHVRSYQHNLHGIGICMVGNFEETHPTSRQMAAFIELVTFLKQDLLAQRPTRFTVHKEIEPNLCPGRNFPLKAMHKLFG